MTDKKKPNAKPVSRKATPAKPAAKRKPVPKKIKQDGEWPAFGDQPSIKLVNPVGKEFGALKRKPAAKKFTDMPIQLAENFSIKELIKPINLEPLAETAPAFMQKPVSGQGIIFDLAGSFAADDLRIANEAGYKAGKADASSKRLRYLIETFSLAFAAGAAAATMVFFTLRHYGVF